MTRSDPSDYPVIHSVWSRLQLICQQCDEILQARANLARGHPVSLLTTWMAQEAAKLSEAMNALHQIAYPADKNRIPPVSNSAQKIGHAVDELRKFINERFDRLCQKYLSARAGEWGNEFLDDLELRAERFHEFNKRMHTRLDRLGVVLEYLAGESDTQAKPTEHTKNEALTFEPGAFFFRSRRVELSGKPWLVLLSLAQAKGKAITLTALQELHWKDSGSGEDAVRSAVGTARAALRRALKAAGTKCGNEFDPIPAVDRGTKRTAWRLDLP
jgi:hypothetical protein